MPFNTTRPHCGSKMRLLDKYGGRRVSCPDCKKEHVAGMLTAFLEQQKDDVQQVDERDLVVQPATKQCPYCSEEIYVDAAKCKHCGEFLDKRRRPPEQSPSSAGNAAVRGLSFSLRVLGDLILIGGVCVLLFYLLWFDTTVEVPKSELFGHTIGGGRVHNIGLMEQKHTGIIVGTVASALGFMLTVTGSIMRVVSRPRS
jgi:hypothetical protein